MVCRAATDGCSTDAVLERTRGSSRSNAYLQETEPAELFRLHTVCRGGDLLHVQFVCCLGAGSSHDLRTDQGLLADWQNVDNTDRTIWPHYLAVHAA